MYILYNSVEINFLASHETHFNLHFKDKDDVENLLKSLDKHLN